MRIDNLELRRTQTLDNKDYWEIVKWEPNRFYGKEEEYELEQDFYVKKGNPRIKVSTSCFTTKEVCYTLARFKGEIDPECGEYRDCPDLVSVGTRPFVLTEDEEKGFKELVKQAYIHFGYDVWKLSAWQ